MEMTLPVMCTMTSFWNSSEETLARPLGDSSALRLYYGTLDKRQSLGDMHLDTLSSINALASLLVEQGHRADAEPLFRKVLEGRRQQLGDQDLDTLATMNSLASLLDAKGDYAKAEPLYREVMESSRQILGHRHPDTLQSICNLAFLLQAQGRLAEVQPLFRRAQGRPRKTWRRHP